MKRKMEEAESHTSSEESPKKKIYLIKCAVPDCSTRAVSGFAKFPSEPVLRDVWLKLCGLTYVGKSARICHDHFKPSDFSTTTKKRHLLPSALPVLNFPNASQENLSRNDNRSSDKENSSSFQPELYDNFEDFETNPWAVENASVFLKYCCPECEYFDQNLDSFTNHALENHANSNILFVSGKNNELSTDLTIKPEVDILKSELDFFTKEEVSDDFDPIDEDIENSDIEDSSNQGYI